MKKNNDEVREIPIKNYFIVLVISIAVIILTLYTRAFYLNYQESKMNTSYFLDKKVNQITTNDLEYTLTEYRDAILYVSYTGSNSIYKMEKEDYYILVMLVFMSHMEKMDRILLTFVIK